MNTAFSHALRLVICPACGEAVQSTPSGGPVQCPLCDAEFVVAARDEQPLPAGLTRGSEIDRLERLRVQDRSSLELPQELAELQSGGVLAADRLADALSAWQKLRSLLTEGEGSAEDAFYGMTLLLHRHMTGQDDDLQLRAVLETALDLLPSPSYRQVLRCVLALLAARVGDVAAAHDWLAPCDPRAYDVVADSAFRHAAAYVATLERQPARVLEVLGPSGHLVPVVEARDAVCTLLRANALERLGRVKDAVMELSDGMRRDPGGVGAYDRVWRELSELALCRSSYHAARARAGKGSLPPASLPQPRRPRTSRTMRRALPWIGLALASLAVALILGPDVRIANRQRLDMLFFVLALSFAVPPLALLLRRSRK